MSFDYHAATSVAEATELLARYGEDAHLMAGGTAFVLLFQQGLLRPGHVVGLREIKKLHGIRRVDGGLEIGALATHRDAERSADVRAYCPALADTFAKVATVRIRNQATVGGNLAHADPAQDPPPMLMALGAVALVEGKGGKKREIPLDALFTGYFETALAHDEVITAVRCPPLPKGTRATYLKFLPRTEDDYATVSVAVVRTPTEVRVALGAAGPTPIRARKVEAALKKDGFAPERIREAAALVRKEVDPLDDARGSPDYKREMARVFTERALRSVL